MPADIKMIERVAICQSLIEAYFIRPEKMGMKDLENHLELLCYTSSDKYQSCSDELKTSIENFDKNPTAYMGVIYGVISVLKRELEIQKERKIFISHSSQDAEIIKSFVERILRLGIGIEHDDIFCTSIESMGIKTGEDIRKHIKENLKNSDFTFLMISENYSKSGICMNEMGVSWAYGGEVRPFLLNTTIEHLGWLYEPTIASKLNENATLDMLYDELTQKYSIDKNVTKWGSQKVDFLKEINKFF